MAQGPFKQADGLQEMLGKPLKAIKALHFSMLKTRFVLLLLDLTPVKKKSDSDKYLFKQESWQKRNNLCYMNQNPNKIWFFSALWKFCVNLVSSFSERWLFHLFNNCSISVRWTASPQSAQALILELILAVWTSLFICNNTSVPRPHMVCWTRLRGITVHPSLLTRANPFLLYRSDNS